MLITGLQHLLLPQVPVPGGMRRGAEEPGRHPGGGVRHGPGLRRHRSPPQQAPDGEAGGQGKGCKGAMTEGVKVWTVKN